MAEELVGYYHNFMDMKLGGVDADAHLVAQHHYSVSKNGKPLATDNLCDCLGVYIKDKATGDFALAHRDYMTKNLGSMLEDLGGKELEVQLVSGQEFIPSLADLESVYRREIEDQRTFYGNPIFELPDGRLEPRLVDGREEIPQEKFYRIIIDLETTIELLDTGSLPKLNVNTHNCGGKDNVLQTLKELQQYATDTGAIITVTEYMTQHSSHRTVIATQNGLQPPDYVTNAKIEPITFDKQANLENALCHMVCAFQGMKDKIFPEQELKGIAEEYPDLVSLEDPLRSDACPIIFTDQMREVFNKKIYGNFFKTDNAENLRKYRDVYKAVQTANPPYHFGIIETRHDVGIFEAQEEAVSFIKQQTAERLGAQCSTENQTLIEATCQKCSIAIGEGSTAINQKVVDVLVDLSTGKEVSGHDHPLALNAVRVWGEERSKSIDKSQREELDQIRDELRQALTPQSNTQGRTHNKLESKER